MGQVAMAKAEGALVSAMMAVAGRLMALRWMLEEMASVAAAWRTVLSVMAEVEGAAALALAVLVRLMVVTVVLVVVMAKALRTKWLAVPLVVVLRMAACLMKGALVSLMMAVAATSVMVEVVSAMAVSVISALAQIAALAAY